MNTGDKFWLGLAVLVIAMSAAGYLFVELPTKADYLSEFSTQEPGMNKYVVDGRVLYADRIEQKASFVPVMCLTKGDKSVDIIVKKYVGYDSAGGGK